MSQEISRRDMLMASLASIAALAVQSGPKITITQCKPICHAIDIELATWRCRRCGRSEKSIQEANPHRPQAKRTFFYGLAGQTRKTVPSG